MKQVTFLSTSGILSNAVVQLFSGQIPFQDIQLKDFQNLLERGERPSLPADDLSRRRGLSMEMEDIIRDCWAQEPMKRPSADKVVERLQLLHPVDERPLNQIGTSFSMHLLRDQVDNPFAILYTESHSLVHQHERFRTLYLAPARLIDTIEGSNATLSSNCDRRNARSGSQAME